MLKNWELLGLKSLFKSFPFSVMQKTYMKPDDEGEFNANVLKSRDWVNIIATNEKDEILLIRQYRFGTDKIELEIPGGIIDPGETPKEAAIRELREETGYETDHLKQIGIVAANPAIMNNYCYTFLASVSKKGKVDFDPDEIIESEFASPSFVKHHLKRGRIKNALVVAAFLWYALLSKNGWF